MTSHFRNAYFALGNKEEEETATYAEAEALRKQVLQADEIQALGIVERMQTRLKAKPVKFDNIKFKAIIGKPGLQSKRIFETIAELTGQTNSIGELYMQWRKSMLGAES